MYVRFVPEIDDPDSEYVWSFFGAIGHLLETGELATYERTRLGELDKWFTAHLKEPTRLARSRRYHADKKAICWFKSTATECISRLREIATILRQHDIPVRMLKSSKPGYIVYEDDLQIAAEPFQAYLKQLKRRYMNPGPIATPS